MIRFVEDNAVALLIVALLFNAAAIVYMPPIATAFMGFIDAIFAVPLCIANCIRIVKDLRNAADDGDSEGQAED